MLVKYRKIYWTDHSKIKMKQYGLSEQRVIRVIRAPFRYEEGILENAVAAMQPASVKKTVAGKPTEWKQEIWVMYKLAKRRASTKQQSASWRTNHKLNNFQISDKSIRVITAWRYPGVSPKRDPVPIEVLEEVRRLL